MTAFVIAILKEQFNKLLLHSKNKQQQNTKTKHPNKQKVRKNY